MDSILSRCAPALRLLEEHGFECVVAGGAVRDLLLGRSPEDLDIATDAPFSLLRKLFPEGSRIGPEEKSVFVLPLGGRPCEITSYSGRTLEADLSRRDFTVNALALRPNGEIVASYRSRRDIDRRILRFNGCCADRLSEDPLRVLRLARFAATLPGFVVHEGAITGIRSAQQSLDGCASERVGREIRLGLEGDPCLFIRVLWKSRTLHALSPLLGDAFPPVRCLLASLKRLDDEKGSLVRRTALLFSLRNDPPAERDIEETVRRLLKRWGWCGEVRALVAALSRYFALPGRKITAEEMAELLLERGAPFLESLFAITEARSSGRSRRTEANRSLFAELSVRQAVGEVLLPSGREIMERLSLASGPLVGRILRALAMESMLNGFSSRERVFERAAVLAKELR